jgi:UPF0755 protein
VLIVLGVIALPFVVAAIWFGIQIFGPTDPGARVDVVVREGWGVSEIGDVLEDRGVVGSSLAFQVWATATRAGSFEAGSYTLHRDEGVRGAIHVLRAGPAREPDVELLLPPGLTVDQIATRVGKLPGLGKEEFLTAARSGEVRSKYQPAGATDLEGLLFPDTYFIGPEEDEVAILRKLVARFDEVADGVGLADATRAAPYETIVVASLIQTEAKLAEDAPLISAVIHNRLGDGMQLQIDSTLCFAKGGCPPAPTNADKQIDSPFNTYRVTGLPPTPIASVTAASLKAALAPADVPYEFYVLAGANGKHVFAETLEEHERNVEDARAKGLL